MASLNALLTAAATVLFATQLTLASAACPFFNYTLNCPYGTVLDYNGCNSCASDSLCKNACPLTCPDANSKLLVTKVQKTPFSAIDYTFECVDCLPLACVVVCPYGHDLDDRNCSTCACHDPCKGVTTPCDAGSALQGTPCPLCSTQWNCICMTAPAKAAAAIKAMAEAAAAFIAAAVAAAQAAAAVVSAEIAAATVNCPDITLRVNCPYGCQMDNNGCNTCAVNNTCRGVMQTCEDPNSRLFVAESKLLLSNDIVYRFECVNCSPLPTTWTTICPFGLVIDQNGCDTPACNDPCNNITLVCDPGSQLQALQIEQETPSNLAQYTCTCMTAPAAAAVATAAMETAAAAATAATAALVAAQIVSAAAKAACAASG